MLPFYELLAIGFMVTFILSLFSGYPVAWLLGGLSMLFAAIAIFLGDQFGMDTFLLTNWAKVSGIVDRLDAIMSNWVLVSLPMFIYMGQMLDRSGVAEIMMRNFVKVFGGIRGGLGLTVIVIGILLAASTGIVGASVVLLAMLAMPIMLQNHYSKAVASGVVAASGTLGILIPPSIMLVLMADQVSVSVGDLFMGALIPGVGLGLLYMVFILAVGILRPDLVPPRPADAEKLSFQQILMAFASTIPTFGLILVVLGSIFFGVATPTEASGLGAFGAVLLAAANRKLNWRVIREVGIETTLTTCFIFAIFIGATFFAYTLRLIGGDELIAEFFKGLGLGRRGWCWTVLAVVFVAGFLPGLVRDRADHPAAAGAGGPPRRHRHDLVPDPHRADAADLVSDAAGGFLAVLPEGRGAQGRDHQGHLRRRHPLRAAAGGDGRLCLLHGSRRSSPGCQGRCTGTENSGKPGQPAQGATARRAR
jgi:tripartite ATP-independent transporter DctM subunit